MKITTLALATASALTLITAPASATLVGATVDVTARYPNTTSIYTDPGTRIVSDSAIEYVAGSYPNYNSSWQVDVFGDHIDITDALSTGLSFGTATFNGFVLDVINGPDILSASIDESSTIVPLSTTISNGDLFINFSGVSQRSGGTARINFTTAGGGAVPEPATWAMMLVGFGATGTALRRRAKPQFATANA